MDTQVNQVLAYRAGLHYSDILPGLPSLPDSGWNIHISTAGLRSN